MKTGSWLMALLVAVVFAAGGFLLGGAFIPLEEHGENPLGQMLGAVVGLAAAAVATVVFRKRK